MSERVVKAESVPVTQNPLPGKALAVNIPYGNDHAVPVLSFRTIHTLIMRKVYLRRRNGLLTRFEVLALIC